ncbi:citrate transporter family protein [[Clostridium] bifermentans ATCC 638]|uniref:GntP family permease n=3 Tax=Paraclostridium TaxID=1849822 RepID=A0A5P3XF52_PARBF|nr:GntP family permease [Paraclostridium bifermentans]RDC50314.1 GntP family permease [Acinetobacter sp. RIT592]EQK41305.1 citrate transporter family protein [[Clostridium] bifermentans ATCC 638] [Paraclostridium bifermentans ATCC 638 = DSM 14991]MBN8048185.1 GntP family permease [Paraclostridium bifermentans]MCE9676026.1 GntP family permease [Paraclostridium bifermentans]MDU3335792.1 GntP family permease [Paraclostridium bifermentans]
MEVQITTLGAILGLLLSIILIIKKFHPAYSLILGAVVGGLVGGAGLTGTVDVMMTGAKDIMPAILRIVTSGVLAGVLIKTGAAAKIADQIIKTLGEKRALFALALSTMILTSVGVFVDVAVITVAPIALAIAKKIGYAPMVILLAMIGGGKAGNVISPNPNTISAAENFGVDLSSLMAANIIPAIVGLIVTVILANMLGKKIKSKKLEEIEDEIENESEKVELPSFISAIVGPVVAIMLLALRPIAGIAIDPLIALPVGGIVGALAMGKIKNINEYVTFGLSKMMPVAILLIGTGTVAGIIKASTLQQTTIAILSAVHMPAFLLAPISGVLMSAATASTTAGATIASATFAPAIIASGVSPLAGGAMVHTGATVLDHLPHGSFFHATAGATNMSIGERLMLIPYESLIGLSMTIISTIMWGIIL